MCTYVCTYVLDKRSSRLTFMKLDCFVDWSSLSSSHFSHGLPFFLVALDKGKLLGEFEASSPLVSSLISNFTAFRFPGEVH